MREGRTLWRRLATAFLAFPALSLLAGCHSLFLNHRLPAGPETETPSFVIRTDVGEGPRGILAAAAEEMRVELEKALPAPEGKGRETKRRIIAFARRADFDRYLTAHLFGAPTAIGFYCDLGEECALAWRDPPGPEDLRVLRHELVHQHLARRLERSLPPWLEEGLAERLALAAPPAKVAAFVESEGAWSEYRARRIAADTIFAALELHGGRRTFEGVEGEPASEIPPPAWSSGGEQGYVYHLLFVRFLLEAEEGRYARALARCLENAVAGEPAVLDLSAHFESLGQVETAFHTFVIRDALPLLSREVGLRHGDALEATLSHPPVGAPRAGPCPMDALRVRAAVRSAPPAGR